jgi:hypothetical protein
MAKNNSVSKSLRIWFLIHFLIDYLFGFPLLFFPELTTGLLGFANVDVLTVRLVGAALLGIGGASLLMHKKSKEVYDTMLSLKLIWSGTAIIAIILSMIENYIWAQGLFLVIFVFFFFLWASYKWKLSK